MKVNEQKESAIDVRYSELYDKKGCAANAMM
jgi:hypothetical protein